MRHNRRVYIFRSIIFGHVPAGPKMSLFVNVLIEEVLKDLLKPAFAMKKPEFG
jgi:hypothetical protein